MTTHVYFLYGRFCAVSLIAVISLTVDVLAGDSEFFSAEEGVPLEITTATNQRFHAGLSVNGWIPQANFRFNSETLGIENNVFLGNDDLDLTVSGPSVSLRWEF